MDSNPLDIYCKTANSCCVPVKHPLHTNCSGSRIKQSFLMVPHRTRTGSTRLAVRAHLRSLPCLQRVPNQAVHALVCCHCCSCCCACRYRCAASTAVYTGAAWLVV